MYVYVTVIELQGPGRLLDLGDVPDQTSLEQIWAWVYARIEPELPPSTRIDPRHFWHNDQFQRKTTLLSDLATTGGAVSLELRPDVYCVAVPREAKRLGFFDPEGASERFIYMLLEGRHAGRCCYELRLPDGAPLNPEDDLIRQGALPRAEVLSQRDPRPDLLLRRRPVYYTFVTSAIVLAGVAGLLLGYLSGFIG